MLTASTTSRDGIRWAVKPANLVPAGLLQHAPKPRELHQVRPSIAPWGNAMRLELDRDLIALGVML